MPHIELGRLLDRTPIKITIQVTPVLADGLAAYAESYRANDGREEPVAEIIPAILQAFLDADRGFKRTQSSLAPTGGDTAG